MTNEQREAIDRLNMCSEYAGLANGTVVVNKADLDTVLSLIKEQQEMCEEYCPKETELKQLRKQIDLMARAFKQDDVRTVEEIKQYFADLVEKE